MLAALRNGAVRQLRTLVQTQKVGTAMPAMLGTNLQRPTHSSSPRSGSLIQPVLPMSFEFSPCQSMQARWFAGFRRNRGPAEITSTFAPYPMVPYGVKRSASFKDAKKSARKAAERARRSAEEKGLLCDPKKQLRMELKRNSGIGWYRAGQIIKHLEMHERGKGPPIDQAMRDRITEIARVVRMGK
eukprot:TRINITY_DN7585_c0_g1_i1.p1 TRINITY_DN7585_c0_g1~~TRINITY_DN7585_c0_g1_i1.p1  ORF type:complete len:186 (+),score=36.86 TRINITY_DN7585_c0_g1_i1:93-650(+)